MREIAKNTKSKILKEQFIPDIIFMYVVSGTISFFDGNKSYTFKAGECGIARKNRLLKFFIEDSQVDFEPIIFCFEEEFLRNFHKKYKNAIPEIKNKDAILTVSTTNLIKDFIQSLKPYYKGIMELDEAFEDLKYEELLIILLKYQPELASVFFNYDVPGKLNLEAFMNHNYKFNVSLERFAYLTGRSLSSFKRDFKTIFNDSPSHWLMQKRLQEAHFLITQKNKKASNIYLELGFEDLSHFSFAFKKQFGYASSELGR